MNAEATTPQHRTRNRWLMSLAIAFSAVVLALGIVAEYAIHNAEPVLRSSIVDTLSSWFHSRVQLDELHISLPHGIEVRGSGLRILYLAAPGTLQGAGTLKPMLSVNQFLFHISLYDLRHLSTRIERVHVQGMELHIPPHSAIGFLTQSEPQNASKKPRFNLSLGKVECKDAKLFIDTDKPGKDPLEFDIQSLELTDVGAGRPLLYTADVINPRPKGHVHASGHIGPWQSADPRATAIDGSYQFDNADLGTIKGLGGILSSTGAFNGQFGHLNVDGVTSTPNFSLDVSGHPMPLTTNFHAIVDGTTGDTTLAPVHAKLGSSMFTCNGAVMRIRGRGHDIALAVDMPRGRIEELLQLGVKTEPPVMSGAVRLKANLHIPPGNVRVAQKMQLAGKFNIQDVEFSNARLQDRIDGMSMRAQGRPEDVKLAGNDNKAEVASQMAAEFSLANATMMVNSLSYQVPGVHVQMDGVYSLDGNVFEFKGHVRTNATASQMVTGWRSALIRPFDGLLKKNGAGVELPISVSGTRGDVRFGLAMHNVGESTKDIAADVKARKQAQAATPH